jgi:hypothetical protein
LASVNVRGTVPLVRLHHDTFSEAPNQLSEAGLGFEDSIVIQNFSLICGQMYIFLAAEDCD